MKTTGSRVGLGAAIRSLTHTESMSQRSQSSMKSRTLSGESAVQCTVTQTNSDADFHKNQNLTAENA